MAAFPFRSKSKGTRKTICLECQREYAHLWYVRTRSPDAKRNHGYGERTIERNCQRISEFLLDHPCIDCGEDDLAVLDFDHVRGVKHAEVSILARSGEPWDVVRAEIDKCEVRCANCHRRETVKRANSYRARMAILSVDSVA
jgi:hypothetical protein